MKEIFFKNKNFLKQWVFHIIQITPHNKTLIKQCLFLFFGRYSRYYNRSIKKRNYFFGVSVAVSLKNFTFKIDAYPLPSETDRVSLLVCSSSIRSNKKVYKMSSKSWYAPLKTSRISVRKSEVTVVSFTARAKHKVAYNIIYKRDEKFLRRREKKIPSLKEYYHPS